jgi:hypothetical protein
MMRASIRGVHPLGSNAVLCYRLRRAGWAPRPEENAQMEFVIGLGFMALIWVVVIYGSQFINQNMR